MSIVDRYNNLIRLRFNDLVQSYTKLDFYNMSKIFEYYVCIKLCQEYGRDFLVYEDIDPNYKEETDLSKIDTGIDICDMINTIVQCKLRKKTLTFKECSTFLASQNTFDEELNKTVIKWENLIIARNDCSKLSKNLKYKRKLFNDKLYNMDLLKDYCKSLIENYVEKPIEEDVKEEIILRDYQIECLQFLKENENKNNIICLPTGCGKNLLISYDMKIKKKYLILVPRIILMYQLKDEIEIYRPEFKNQIELIGDCLFKQSNKNITICVYNSIDLIKDFSIYEKIYIDEAHNIYKSSICSMYDDDEDENLTFKKIIRKLSKYENTVLLSATIDNLEGYNYFHRDIRKMIQEKYLTDYNIKIPIFESENYCTISKYLINNYRSCIIYCNSIKKSKEMCSYMNIFQTGCCKHIDCYTSFNERNKILKDFNEGKLQFIINVKILIEGFNSKICEGVCFLDLPSNKNTIIQIIGRCLRLHENKKMSNVIIMYKNVDEIDDISSFLNIVSNNDSRIRKSYLNKKLSGYINFDINVDVDIKNYHDIELKFEIIYDKYGVMLNKEEYFLMRLNEVKKFIDDNERRPNKRSKELSEKRMGQWLIGCMINYNRNMYIMKNINVRIYFENFLEEYKKYFVSDEEKWLINFENVKKFINENDKTPNSMSKNSEEKKLGKWLSHQNTNCKNKIGSMKIENQKKLFEEFLTKYNEYFVSNEEKWLENFENVKGFINKNEKLPNSVSKIIKEKKLGMWLVQQKMNYKKNTHSMKIENQKKLFEEFLDEYGEYFLNEEEKWLINFENVKKFINENDKTPNSMSKNSEEKKLGRWIVSQREKYKLGLMKIKNQKKLFEEFLDEYNKYNEEKKWLKNFNELKHFIKINKKLPYRKSKNIEERKLQQWYQVNRFNYNRQIYSMKNENQRNLFKQFLEEFLEEYNEFFVSDDEKRWLNNFNKLKEFINKNKKTPSDKSKNIEEKKIGNWYYDQRSNYNRQIYSMKNENQRNLFKQFLEQYSIEL